MMSRKARGPVARPISSSSIRGRVSFMLFAVFALLFRTATCSAGKLSRLLTTGEFVQRRCARFLPKTKASTKGVGIVAHSAIGRHLVQFLNVTSPKNHVVRMESIDKSR